jgi:hypothetical protein
MRCWCCSNFLFLVVALKYFDPGKQEEEQKARLLYEKQFGSSVSGDI